LKFVQPSPVEQNIFVIETAIKRYHWISCHV